MADKGTQQREKVPGKYAYAISDGEGTLIAYGQAYYWQITSIAILAGPQSSTLIVGPADGTGE